MADFNKKGKLVVVNREIKSVNDADKNFIQLSENKEEGLAWLPVKSFKNGRITIRMRGKDVLQRSFIGLAFHGLNHSTYDAVYCRPFNFLQKILFVKYMPFNIFHTQFSLGKSLEKNKMANLKRKLLIRQTPMIGLR